MRMLDHLAIPVREHARSRDWYVDTLGLELEFDVPERRTSAVRDTRDVTVFLTEGAPPADCSAFAFWYQVPDVIALHRELVARGVAFHHGPEKVDWGFGAELRDPDGYRVCVWDEATMAKGGP